MTGYRRIPVLIAVLSVIVAVSGPAGHEPGEIALSILTAIVGAVVTIRLSDRYLR